MPHGRGSKKPLGRGQIDLLRGRCPLWVKSRHRKGSAECPLYPQKRTFANTIGVSTVCPQADATAVILQASRVRSFPSSCSRAGNYRYVPTLARRRECYACGRRANHAMPMSAGTLPAKGVGDGGRIGYPLVNLRVARILHRAGLAPAAPSA